MRNLLPILALITLRRRRTLALSLIVVGATTVAVPRPADACSPIGNREHVLDEAHAADVTAPSGVTTSSYVSTTKLEDCGPTGTLHVFVDAIDDMTPDDKLGYEVRNISNPDLRGPSFAVRPEPMLGIMIDFEASELAGFTVDFDIAAVDLNGNVGPATPFHAEWVNPDPPSGGCATGRGMGWLAVLAVALLAQRRRRR